MHGEMHIIGMIGASAPCLRGVYLVQGEVRCLPGTRAPTFLRGATGSATTGTGVSFNVLSPIVSLCIAVS